MLVAGVPLSLGAVTRLARRLDRAGRVRLAHEVWLAAFDADWTELQLAPSDEDEILAVLQICPVALWPLREALQAKARERSGAVRQPAR